MRRGHCGHCWPWNIAKLSNFPLTEIPLTGDPHYWLLALGPEVYHWPHGSSFSHPSPILSPQHDNDLLLSPPPSTITSCLHLSSLKNPSLLSQSPIPHPTLFLPFPYKTPSPHSTSGPYPVFVQDWPQHGCGHSIYAEHVKDASLPMTQHGCQQPVAALIATSMCSSRTMRSGPLTVPAAQPAARRSWVVGWSEVGGEWQLTEGDGLNVLIGKEQTRPEREGVRSKQVSAKTYILLFLSAVSSPIPLSC